MESFDLSARQAQAILDMRLAKLTGLEREALVAEIKELALLIARLEEILGSETVLMAVVIDRARGGEGSVRRRRAAPRSSTSSADIDVEDMIAPEEMVVTVTHGGYVKRNPKIALPGAAARRRAASPARRRTRRTSSRSCSSPRRTTRS